jgi:hypothetical protein
MNPWSDVDDIAYSRDAMRVAPVNVGSDPQVLVPPPDRFVILIHYVIFDYSWYPLSARTVARLSLHLKKLE